MKEIVYSKEYWQAIDRKPKRRVIEKVVDAIQLTLAQRRANRMFNKEFNNLIKEQENK